jgi:hypothetical protein
MKWEIPERFEDFTEGDVEDWVEMAKDDFDAMQDELTKTGKKRELQAVFKSFEKIMLQGAAAGYETASAYVLASFEATPASTRLAYLKRAYELHLVERKEQTFENLESTLFLYYDPAHRAAEIGVIYEGENDLKNAAQWYERSLRHLEEAADMADTLVNFPNTGKPSRPGVVAGLERVRRLMQ